MTKSHWTIKTASIAIIITIIASPLWIPFWILWGPIYLIFKTIVTIWQPYFFKKQSIKWDKLYQENRKQDIFIDYPPTEGKLLGIGPWHWNKKEYDYE